MRVPNLITCLILALPFAVLGGCSKEPPPPATTAEANAPRSVAAQERELAARLAEQKQALDEKTRQARETADRVRRVKLVADLGRSWSNAINEVRAAPRSKLGEPIAKMESLRSEAQGLDVDNCTMASRDTLMRAMGIMIDAVKAFQNQGSGDQTEAVTKATTESQNLFAESNKQLLECN